MAVLTTNQGCYPLRLPLVLQWTVSITVPCFVRQIVIKI